MSSSYRNVGATHGSHLVLVILYLGGTITSAQGMNILAHRAYCPGGIVEIEPELEAGCGVPERDSCAGVFDATTNPQCQGGSCPDSISPTYFHANSVEAILCAAGLQPEDPNLQHILCSVPHASGVEVDINCCNTACTQIGIGHDFDDACEGDAPLLTTHGHHNFQDLLNDLRLRDRQDFHIQVELKGETSDDRPCSPSSIGVTAVDALMASSRLWRGHLHFDSMHENIARCAHERLQYWTDSIPSAQLIPTGQDYFSGTYFTAGMEAEHDYQLGLDTVMLSATQLFKDDGAFTLDWNGEQELADLVGMGSVDINMIPLVWDSYLSVPPSGRQAGLNLWSTALASLLTDFPDEFYWVQQEGTDQLIRWDLLRHLEMEEDTQLTNSSVWPPSQIGARGVVAEHLHPDTGVGETSLAFISSDAYIQVADAGDPILSNLWELSFDGWIYPTTLQGTGTVLSINDEDGQPNVFIRREGDTLIGSVRLITRRSDGAQLTRTVSLPPGTLQAAHWYRVRVAYSSLGQRMNLTIRGEDDTTISRTQTWNTNDRLMIEPSEVSALLGALPTTEGRLDHIWAGNLDEVRLYKHYYPGADSQGTFVDLPPDFQPDPLSARD